MNEKLPRFDFYPADWLGSSRTRAMCAFQRGIYIDLLAFQWREGRVPTDPLEVSLICGLSVEDADELRNMWGRILDAFVVSPDGRSMVNARLERERREALERYERAVASGRKGGQKAASSKPKGASSRPRSGSLKHSPSPSPSPGRDPLPPKGGTDWRELVVGTTLDTPEARAAIERWLQHKAERKQGYKTTGLRGLIHRLASWGSARAVAAIDHSIAANYAGPYEPSQAAPGGAQRTNGQSSIKYEQYRPDPTPRNPNPPKLSELFEKQKADKAKEVRP